MTIQPTNSQTMPIGVVLRRTPGVTRWAKWCWRAVDVLPGAGEADWKVLRQTKDVVEFHAATAPLILYRGETDAYLTGLAERQPSLYVVMRETGVAERPLEVVLVTASPFEGQLYTASGEELVEKVAISEGLQAWIAEFCERHHEEEAFVKRRRDKQRRDLVEDGKGDARIRQLSDVYRAPGSRRKTGEAVH